MKTLSTILQRMVQNHIALLIMLFCCSTTMTFGQQTSAVPPTTSASIASVKKTIDGDKTDTPVSSSHTKGTLINGVYESAKGVTFKVGDKITLGTGTATGDKTGSFNYITETGVASIIDMSKKYSKPSDINLAKGYAGGTYVIEKINLKRVNPLNVFSKATVICIEIKVEGVSYRIDIDSALAKGEVVPN